MKVPTPGAKKGGNMWARVGSWVLVVGGILVLAYAMRARSEGGPLVAAGDRQGIGDFVAADLSGNAWRINDYRGQVVLVNIFATWCPPCQEETPGLVALSRQYAGKGLQVVGVSLDEGGKSVIEPFVKQYKIDDPVLLPDANSPFARIQAIPVTYLVDQQGRVAKRYEGAVTQSTFEHDVKQLLADPAMSKRDG
jgi:thiol-disulfide isomerase/thioredoxin